MSFFQPGARPGDTSQPCPICGRGQPVSSRYRKYLCGPCVAKAADEPGGRRLQFFNTGIGGGFAARYADTKEPYDGGHVCFVEGVRCRAGEARFGGIVLQPIEEN